MARVFLSYDRDDVVRAQSVAALLERAGHSVWWDRHIKGGSQFSDEIEKELDQAEAVLVLWSQRSVRSAWVRDEAAAGRDSGRLVPVLLDHTKPPLGFRQYQNVDLSEWPGHGHTGSTSQLLASIDSLPGDKTPVRRPQEQPDARKRSFPARAIAIGMVLVSIAIAAALFVRTGWEPDIRTVAVQPADASARTQAVAHDLLVQLTTLQTATAGLVRLQRAEAAAPMKADLIFQAAASADPQHAGQSLALLDGRDRAVLWSENFEQGSGSPGDLKLQVAYTAARVLQCGIEGLPPGKRPLDQPTLKLYLNGCARLAEDYGTGAATLIPVFSQVVQKSPDFQPAWAKLLLADASVVGEGKESHLDPTVRRHIGEARKLDPNIPEAILVELAAMPLSSYQEALRLLEGARQRNPDNPDVLTSYADQLRTVGRMQESVESARRAAALDPLSPSTRGSYVLALAYAGRVDAAKKELQTLEKLWPGTAILQEIQFRFRLRFGNPNQALQMARSLDIGGENQQRFLVARANPTQQNIDSMISQARPQPGDLPMVYLGFMAQALGEFGRTDQLFKLLNDWPNREDVRSLGDTYFRPALSGLRHDPRFMQIAAKVGLVSYWKTTGHWPDYCSEPDLPYNCVEAAKRISS